ncbi:MAG TPA: type II secretion system F family protein [bacterium]|nr:type II secretion system F family protein [bacterium]
MATTYVWKGRTSSGEIVAGESMAKSKGELIMNLRRRRVTLTSAKEKSKSLSLGLGRLKGVSTKDLAVFTRQFSTMINSGLPLVQCLDILGKQAEHDNFRKVITSTMREVESGSTLADALSKHPNVFGDLYVNMVEAGETGGVLDVILMRLAAYLEKMNTLKRKIKGAMTYPAVIVTVTVVATVFMLLFIIPVFAKLFSDYGGTLPLPTRIVMMLSNFIRHQWWLIAGVIVAAVVGLRRYYKSKDGRAKIDRLLLSVPIFGPVLLKTAVARFTRTLGTLVSSGVPILEGLEITARAAGNVVVKEAVIKTRASISSGHTIAEPLRQSAVFPPMVVQMISVGEETGALDEMLCKIADFYDEEVDAAVDAMTSIIEPVMIVMMGGIVGGMVVSMYLPIFKLVTVIVGK